MFNDFLNTQRCQVNQQHASFSRSSCWVESLHIFTSNVINTRTVCSKASHFSASSYNDTITVTYQSGKICNMPATLTLFIPVSCQNGLKNLRSVWIIIITTGIYESHQAFSREGLHLKVTPAGIASDCRHSETILPDKLPRLTKPFKTSSHSLAVW